MRLSSALPPFSEGGALFPLSLNFILSDGCSSAHIGNDRYHLFCPTPANALTRGGFVLLALLAGGDYHKVSVSPGCRIAQH
jgi:hypothetical protein